MPRAFAALRVGKEKPLHAHAQTTAGGKDYIVRETTIQPGGSTGWHDHDGTLYAVVEQGTLTRTESDRTTSHTHTAGTTIVEPSGTDHVHIGRNLGTASAPRSPCAASGGTDSPSSTDPRTFDTPVIPTISVPRAAKNWPLRPAVASRT